MHVIELCRGILSDVSIQKLPRGQNFGHILVIYIFWSNTNLYLKII